MQPPLSLLPLLVGPPAFFLATAFAAAGFFLALLFALETPMGKSKAFSTNSMSSSDRSPLQTVAALPFFFSLLEDKSACELDCFLLFHRARLGNFRSSVITCPSRFQALCDAFRDARGQSDQDLVGKAFDFDFESTRGKLSMQEYGMGHALQRGREQERPSSQRCCLAFPIVQALCFALVRGRCTVAIALRSHQVSCQIVDMAPQPAWTRRRREHLLEDAYGTADEAGEY